MAKTIQTWNFSRGKDGFAIHLYESPFWKYLFGEILEAIDFGWWGKYKNLPFCWINPWRWTWRIGTEDHNLGSLWCDIGNKFLNFAYDMHCSVELKRIPVSDSEVQEKFPRTWEWAHYWDDEEDE